MRARDVLYSVGGVSIFGKVVALVINDKNVARTLYLTGELDRTEIPAGPYSRLVKEVPDKNTVFALLRSHCDMIYMADRRAERQLHPCGPR